MAIEIKETVDNQPKFFNTKKRKNDKNKLKTKERLVKSNK